MNMTSTTYFYVVTATKIGEARGVLAQEKIDLLTQKIKELEGQKENNMVVLEPQEVERFTVTRKFKLREDSG